MTPREATMRRKRLQRREAQDLAYREWVCGGPLVDAFEPIVGGDDFGHAERVAAALEERARRCTAEATLLAIDFAKRCWVVRAVRREMLAEFVSWYALGMPRPLATHSTLPTTPGTATIPPL